MKVKSVKKVKLSEPVPVYDITVPGYENFCVAPGVVVHNSKDLADAFAGVVAGLTLKNFIWSTHGVAVSRHLQSVVDAQATRDGARDDRLEMSA